MCKNLSVMPNTCNFKLMVISNTYVRLVVENAPRWVSSILLKGIFIVRLLLLLFFCLYLALPQFLFSCQIRNLEEAVQELWRRRDEADKDLIASLRAAAGLPTQEEIFDISPFSDDEDSGPPPIKNEHARSLKFSLKGLDDKSSKKSKEKGKKSSNKKSGKKKGNGTSSISITDADGRSGKNAGIHKNKEMLFSGEPDGDFSPHAGSLIESTQAVNEAAISKQKHVGEISATNITKARTIKIKSNMSHGLTNREEIGSNSGVPKTTQGPKLVIHLGGRSRNITGEDLTSSKGMPCLLWKIFVSDEEFL